jgi:hypothetical protein
MTLTHTFGGSALDRYIYEFEPDTDGAGDAGAAAPAGDATTATVDPAATGDTGATVDPAATADPAAAGGDTSDDGVDETQFWNAVRDLVAEEFHARSNGAGPQAATQPTAAADSAGDAGFDWGTIDPLSDEFGAQLGQGISHAVQQAMQEALNPLTSTIEQSQLAQRAEQGEQILQDIIHDTISRGDDLTDEGKSGVRPLVDIFFNETARRFGAQNPRASPTGRT